MFPPTLEALRARQAEIQRRWEILLRIEPVTGPLANPDALIHLIPETLEQIWRELAGGATTGRSIAEVRADLLPACECGNNPYLAYFTAGEQAVLETLILIQVELPAGPERGTDAADLIEVVRRLARLEIDAFCGLCLNRCQTEECRHGAGRGSVVRP